MAGVQLSCLLLAVVLTVAFYQQAADADCAVFVYGSQTVLKTGQQLCWNKNSYQTCNENGDWTESQCSGSQICKETNWVANCIAEVKNETQGQGAE